MVIKLQNRAECCNTYLGLKRITKDTSDWTVNWWWWHLKFIYRLRLLAHLRCLHSHACLSLYLPVAMCHKHPWIYKEPLRDNQDQWEPWNHTRHPSPGNTHIDLSVWSSLMAGQNHLKPFVALPDILKLWISLYLSEGWKERINMK